MSLLDRITDEWVSRGILPVTHFGTPNLPELTQEQEQAIDRVFAIPLNTYEEGDEA